MSELFSNKTTAIFFGLQPRAIQSMLDFDYVCERKPSIKAIVRPQGSGKHKCFFGDKEIFIPIFKTLKEAMNAFPKTTVLVNFASMRSAFQPSIKAIKSKNIKTIAIIAEGIPERQTRILLSTAKKNKKTIIGPATVGGISAGNFRIGNTGGTIENIIESKLYRPGSVGLVTKSGGLANELFRTITENSNGIVEGIAIGGDRFPGSTFLDHCLRFEKNPKIKLIVLLGELGGGDELEVAKAIKNKKIKKPVIAWVSGTCAKFFPTEVQFGHAGAKANTQKESAEFKLKELKKAGAIIPKSFNELGKTIKREFKKLKKQGLIKKTIEKKPKKIPLDFKEALRKKIIRKNTNFTCSISDERGKEVTYNKVPLSSIATGKHPIGRAIGLLWFKKDLPEYACKYLELCVTLTADHGPAVSGAHNTIVASRAGKDLVAAVCSGLLTIGTRFGGAIEDSAKTFEDAHKKGLSPKEFVEQMKKTGKYIPGIGHRVKSVRNPDKRVEILKAFAKKHFKSTKYLDFALKVEKITTKKKENLILNVDGCIAQTFLDFAYGSGIFTKKETKEILDTNALNGIFVLARTIGLIAHSIDQKRIKEKLYRHPWEDILYL